MKLPAGYTARPATEDDVDAMVALANAYDVADFGRPDTAREHLADGFRVPGFDAQRDTWLVLEPRGSIVAFGIVGQEGVSLLEAFARVHPEHAGRGIGSAIATAMEARAAGIARRRSAGLVMHNSITSTDPGARRLLDERGYRLVRFFWHMERALQRTDLRIVPDGEAFVVRTMKDEHGLRSARAALDEAFGGHWMFHPPGFEEWTEHLGSMSGTVVVALDGDEVAGVVTFMPTSDWGWIEEIGVREPWRGRGLGASLLRHAFARLAQAGIHEVRLNVDAENATGATRLYERVGMLVRREWLVYEKRFRGKRSARADPAG